MTIIELIEEFKELYPEFAEQIENYEDKVSGQSAAIKTAINEAGTDGTLDLVTEVLTFIGDIIKNADDELKKIIAISILEHLEVEREQIDRMPEMVRELFNEIATYNQETG